MTAAARPTVGVIGTGGTISIVTDDPLDSLDYADSGRILEVDELVGRMPDLSHEVEVVPIPFRTIKSSDMSPAIWLELRALVQRALVERPQIAGLVVTHGTATLEETAYFLHLTLDVERPVVVVGAQRPSSAVSSDAPANYVAAVRAAAAEASRGRGVMVVMNDQIHCARDVRKTSNHRLETFRNGEVGVLGHVDADGVSRYDRRAERMHTATSRFAGADLGQLPRVDVVSVYAGVDAWALDAAMAAGARGIVVASLPPSLNPQAIDEGVQRARAAGVVVVQASRAWQGRVLRRRTFRERGLVAADDLSPQAARVLLMLALTRTEDPDRIQELFDTH